MVWVKPTMCKIVNFDNVSLYDLHAIMAFLLYWTYR